MYWRFPLINKNVNADKFFYQKCDLCKCVIKKYNQSFFIFNYVCYAINYVAKWRIFIWRQKQTRGSAFLF